MKTSPLETIRRSLRMLNQSYGIYDDKTWKRFGISYALSQVLFAITEMDEPVAKKISQTLQLEKSTLSRFLDKLIDKRLITYSVDPADARSKIIRLTAKGESLVAQLNFFGNTITSTGLEGLSADEVEAIQNSLQTLAKNLAGKRFL